MSEAPAPGNRDDFCYKHPDRRSYVLCQRCTQTVCGDCQTPAAVGVVCPDCMSAQRKNRTAAQRQAERRRTTGAVALADGRLRAVLVLITAMIVVQLVNLLGEYAIPALMINRHLMFAAPFLYPELNGGIFEPWRVLTVVLTHGGLLHLGLNVVMLWMIGRVLEPLLGTWRFLALFLLSAAGGSLAVTLLAFTTPVVGASGAVFGLLGAYLVIARNLGGDVRGILIVVAINLVVGFIPGLNISWQAHLGGLVTGLIVGAIFARTRRNTALQAVLLAVLAAAMVGAFVVAPSFALSL